MMDRLRFGVIGCGAISFESHLPALAKSRQAQLVATIDSDLAWAQSTARRFGAKWASARYQELVGRIDAAIVATPNSTHADISCHLLENGIHVLCEKPIATTAADAKRMFATAQAKSTRLMVAQSRRFTPVVQFLQKIIQGGYLDRNGTLSVSSGSVYGRWRTRTDFRLRKEFAGGGVMMDLGVHVIDIGLWLFDDRPKAVEYSQSTSPGWEVEDDAEIKLIFPQGGRALLAVSYTHEMNALLEYRGLDGWTKTGLDSNSLDLFISRSRGCRVSGVIQPVLASMDPYIAQLEHFCSAIRSGEPFLVRTDQVILGLEIIEACYRHPGRFDMDI
jgi:predicted dehydrogenase